MDQRSFWRTLSRWLHKERQAFLVIGALFGVGGFFYVLQNKSRKHRMTPNSPAHLATKATDPSKPLRMPPLRPRSATSLPPQPTRRPAPRRNAVALPPRTPTTQPQPTTRPSSLSRLALQRRRFPRSRDTIAPLSPTQRSSLVIPQKRKASNAPAPGKATTRPSAKAAPRRDTTGDPPTARRAPDAKSPSSLKKASKQQTPDSDDTSQKQPQGDQTLDSDGQSPQKKALGQQPANANNSPSQADADRSSQNQAKQQQATGSGSNTNANTYLAIGQMLLLGNPNIGRPPTRSTASAAGSSPSQPDRAPVSPPPPGSERPTSPDASPGSPILPERPVESTPGPDRRGPDRSTSPPQLLTRVQGECQELQWDPGGRTLAYEVYDPGTSRKSLQFYQHVASSNLSSIATALARYTYLHQLRWAPSTPDHRFLYVGRTSTGRDNIGLYPEGDLKLNSASHDVAPAWSADSQRVAFTSYRSGQGDLYWFQTKDQALKQLTNDAASTELFATWSPRHSHRLLYLRQTQQSAAIYILTDVRQPYPVRLIPPDDKSTAGRPAWSPTGDTFAFYDTTNKGDLYLMNPTSRAVRRVARALLPPYDHGPVWSPDGRTLFAIAQDNKTGRQIVAIDAASGRQQDISTAPHVPQTLALAQDSRGQWLLAFSVSSPNTCALYLKTMPPLSTPSPTK